MERDHLREVVVQQSARLGSRITIEWLILIASKQKYESSKFWGMSILHSPYQGNLLPQVSLWLCAEWRAESCFLLKLLSLLTDGAIMLETSNMSKSNFMLQNLILKKSTAPEESVDPRFAHLKKELTLHEAPRNFGI